MNPWEMTWQAESAQPAPWDRQWSEEPSSAKPSGATERVNAFTGGVVEGLPIVGAPLKAGAERLAAITRALLHGTPYDAELRAVQDYARQNAESHPILNNAGQIAGGVTGIAPAVAAAPAAFGVGGGGLLMRSAASAATGAGIGGVDAAVRSGGDLDKTREGGLLGLVTGAAAPGIGRMVGKAAESVVNRVAAPKAPTAEALKEASGAAYATAKEAGVVVRPEPYQKAMGELMTRLIDEGIDPTLHPNAFAALKRIAEVADQPLALQHIETLRRVVGSAAGSKVPGESRLAGIMKDKIDDLVARLTPDDVIAGDPEKGAAALGAARDLWSRGRKSEVVDDLIERAKNRAGQFSGSGYENALRTEFRALVQNKNAMRGFSEEERAALQRVARGGPVENAMRALGKLAPTGAVSAALGIGMGSAAGGTIGAIALPVAGILARQGATMATKANVERAGQVIRSGGALPTSPLALPAGENVDLLTRMLLLSSSPRAASPLLPQ